MKHSPTVLLAALLVVVVITTDTRSQTVTPTPAGAAQSQEGKSAELAEASELSRKVVTLYTEQKFAEALPLAERAFKLRESVLGKEDVRVADAASNVARVLIALGKWSKADEYLRRAVSIYEKSPAGQKSLAHARTLDTLVTVSRFWKSDFTGAAEYAERSLAIKENLAGIAEQELISNLYTLAELYELRDRTKDAVALQKRVIAIREKKAGEEPYRLFVALERFICLTERLKLDEEAERALGRLSEVAEEIKRKMNEPRPAADTTVAGGVINGKALSKPPPPYPPAARDARVSGQVKVWITVNEGGRVIEAAACGHPLLTDASVRAAYAARFSPTLLSGKPVKVTGMITYNFNLR